MIHTCHAVLDTAKVTWLDNAGGWQRELSSHYSLVDLMELAERHKFTHLWVLPSAGIAPTRQWAAYDLACWDFGKAGGMMHWKGDLLKSAYGYRTGGGAHAVHLLFPAQTRWAGSAARPGWMQQMTPVQLLGTLSLLEHKFDVPVGGSPATVGWRLIDRLSDPKWMKRPEINLDGCHFSEGAFNLIGARPLQAVERYGTWLYKFDGNSAFPSALASNDGFVGAGTPVHVFHGQGIEEKKVGVWRVTITRRPAWLPFPICEGNEDWLTAPIIRVLRFTGHELTVHEGWEFPEKHLTLQPWAQFMWDARQKFAGQPRLLSQMPIYRAARDATKQIANATLGLTLYGGFEEDGGEPSEKKRPDINAVAVARWFEVMYHKLIKINELSGHTPVLAYIDALYYVGYHESARQEYPHLLNREKALGGFKYAGRIALTSEVRDILSDDSSVAMKLGRLNALGWEQEQEL